MRRWQSIRRLFRRDPARGAAEIAFWLLCVLAALAGGPAAVNGFPALASLLLPSGLFAAKAEGRPPASSVLMPMDFAVPGGRHATAVLTPVPARGLPDWLAERVARIRRGEPLGALPHETGTRPAIAIVIDDLGIDAIAARRAIALPRAVTLSFLPYPPATPELARAADAAGHQVLVHVPMEPEGREDPGPFALTTHLSAGEIARRLDWALARVPGFAGVNNHMGSRFTQDRGALIPVMRILAERRVFFLDSMTTPDSAALPLARLFGVAGGQRDVFLDDEIFVKAIDGQLAEAERVARANGIAIAIGHPHRETLDALAQWTASAEARGFALVDAKDAIRFQAERAARRYAAAHP